MGLQAACFAEWAVTRTFSLVTEVGYTQRRFKEVYLASSTDPREGIVAATSRLDYLALPVLAKVRHVDAKATGYLLAGPRLDLLIHRKAGRWGLPDRTLDSPMAAGFRSWAAGGVVGAGVEIEGLLPTVLIAELRYSLDVTDSMRRSGQRRQDGTAVAVWRSAFAFSVGLLF